MNDRTPAGAGEGWLTEVRSLQDRVDCEDQLRRLLPPRKGRWHLVVPASKYLDIARMGGDAIPPGADLVVDGDLRLEGPKSARGVRRLSRAIVRGSVVLDRHQDIEVVDLLCCGGFIANDCLELRELRGRIFGNARVERCPKLDRLGADLSCESDLRIIECDGLTALNCSVGGDFEGRGGQGAPRHWPGFRGRGGRHFPRLRMPGLHQGTLRGRPEA